MKILDLITTYGGVITAITTVIGGIWVFVKYLESLKDKRFKNYHELIDQLVNEQLQPDRAIKLDRQIAIVFELRQFPSYFPVSKRILTDLKNQWSNERIKKEIELTIKYMSSMWLKRACIRFWRIY